MDRCLFAGIVCDVSSILLLPPSAFVVSDELATASDVCVFFSVVDDDDGVDLQVAIFSCVFACVVLSFADATILYFVKERGI